MIDGSSKIRPLRDRLSDEIADAQLIDRREHIGVSASHCFTGGGGDHILALSSKSFLRKLIGDFVFS